MQRRSLLRGRPFQAGITTSFHEVGRSVGGIVGVGGDSLFAKGGAGVATYPDIDARSTDVSASVGAALTTSRSGRIVVCPVASVGFGAGPDVMGVDVSSASVTAGGQAGVIAFQTGSLMIVPTLSLDVSYLRVSADFGPDFEEASESDTSGAAGLGVGFIFSNAIGVGTAIGIPFASGLREAGVLLWLLVNFAR